MKSYSASKNKGLSLSELLVAVAITWFAFAFVAPKLTSSSDVTTAKRDTELSTVSPAATATAAEVAQTVTVADDGCSDWSTVFGPTEKSLASTAATHMARHAAKNAQLRFRSTEKSASASDSVWIVEKRTCR